MNTPFDRLLETRSRLKLPGAGLDWLDAMRADNEQCFQQLGLPTLRDEDWKYTSIKPIASKTFTLAESGAAPTREGPRAFDVPHLDAYRLVLVDGHFAPGLSSDAVPAEGVYVGGLARILDQDPARLEPWLGRLAKNTEHGFRALNSAFIQDGIFVHVPAGTRLDKPIELCCVQSGQAEEIVSQPRNLVVAGEGARFTVIERYVHDGEGRYLTNAITEVFAAANAEIEHYKLQQEGDNAYHIASWLIEQQAGSRVITHNVALGGAIGRTDIRVRLEGAHAYCELNGVYVLNGRQHVDNHTKIDHCVPDTRSNEFYKGVMDGRSRAVFHGRVVVHPDAQRSDARQQNKNLLLSDHAEIDTKPQLEIHADDVACSHGATVGQLDAESMFYLRSRGVDEQTARSLLTFAFANDVIDRFDLAPLRAYVEQALANKMFSVDDLETML